MMRLAAECETVPSGIMSEVSKLKEASGRHIQRVGEIGSLLLILIVESYPVAMQPVLGVDRKSGNLAHYRLEC